MKRHLVPAVGVLLAAVAVTSTAAVRIDTRALREATTVNGVRTHQAALQAIADANGGTRAAGTPGYDASAAYVAGKLRAAGYVVTEQPFAFDLWTQTAPSTLAQVAPNAVTYVEGADGDYLLMEYSGAADLTAPVAAAGGILIPSTGGSTSGCTAADFAGVPAGSIALVQRGTCSFEEKALNAKAAGAAAIIIFNEGNSPDREGLIGGTAGSASFDGFPILDMTFARGEELYNLIPLGLRLRIVAQTHVELDLTTHNVIADTPGGRADRVVVVGAHLDSVAEGPGINDNGSGTAAILEVVLQMARLGIVPVNKVRFAFWGAEESGLVGSQHYVDQLSARDIKNIAVNLNFDMVGSPNFVRFVYDGDGSATPVAGPNGSKLVERVFEDYFASENLPAEATAFDGRSDYNAFIGVGIPAGGLFTGAEGIKSLEEAAIYGGTAGLAYDPCYHQACDTFANNSNTALDQMSDAIAHSVLTFALTTSAVNGTDKGKGKGQYDGVLDFAGSHRIR